MPKRGMRPVRRDQLIRATITTVARYGFPDATVGRISRDAGLSVGTISHYFGGKDALLEATMAYLLEDLRAATAAALRGVRDPMTRIEALVDVVLGSNQYRPEIVRTWLAFWAQAPFSEPLRRAQTIYSRRLRSNVRDALSARSTRAESAAAADAICALIDGYWLRSALTSPPPDPDLVRADVRRAIAKLLR